MMNSKRIAGFTRRPMSLALAGTALAGMLAVGCQGTTEAEPPYVGRVDRQDTDMQREDPRQRNVNIDGRAQDRRLRDGRDRAMRDDDTLRLPHLADGDALLVRRTMPDTARAGEPLTYAIEVRNVSEYELRDIHVKEWRSGGLEYGGAMVDGRPVGEAGSVYATRVQDAAEMSAGARKEMAADAAPDNIWTIEKLAPGQSKTIQVEGVAPKEGQVRSCVTATYEPGLCMTTDIVRPSLTVRRMIEEDTALLCEEVPVRYVVTNEGSAAARSVMLSEKLPKGVQTADGRNQVRFRIDSVAPGQSVERTAALTGVRTGEYESHATVASGGREARTPAGTIRFVRPELKVSMDAPPQEYVGRDVPLQIRVENVGDGVARDARLVVPGLDELQQVSVSTANAERDGETIRLGAIEPGEARAMTIYFAAAEPQTHQFDVTARAFCAESATAGADVQLLGVEAVRLETIDLTDPVVVGEETTYEVKVKNQGTATSLNVTVTATLPPEMAFVDAVGDSSVAAEGQTVVLGPIRRLPPGEVASWRITAEATSPAKTRLRLEMTSNATTRPVIEQEPTTIFAEAARPGRE